MDQGRPVQGRRWLVKLPRGKREGACCEKERKKEEKSKKSAEKTRLKDAKDNAKINKKNKIAALNAAQESVKIGGPAKASTTAVIKGAGTDAQAMEGEVGGGKRKHIGLEDLNDDCGNAVPKVSPRGNYDPTVWSTDYQFPRVNVPSGEMLGV